MFSLQIPPEPYSPEVREGASSPPTGAVDTLEAAAVQGHARQPLKVLIAEDNPLDCELVVQELINAGFAPDWQRVETEAAYLAGLQAGPDLVLSDFQMPCFNGLRALELLQQSGLDIPFILVSGTIGEDTAVAAMRHGASDYLLKDRLGRLGPAVRQAFAEGRLRRERGQIETELRRSEERFRLLAKATNDAIWDWDLRTDRLLWNDGLEKLFGYEKAKVDPTIKFWSDHIHPAERTAVVEGLQHAIDHGADGWRDEYRFQCRDGHYASVMDRGHIIRDETGRGVRMIGGMTDQTERRRLELAQVEGAAFIHDVLNSLTAAVVVLDREGNITATNEVWERFGRENGGSDCLKQNYLTVCANSVQQSGNADARAAADGIRSVLAGMAAEFSLEYPCHSPTERRWFLMHVSPLGDGSRGVVVAHEKITARKLSEEKLQRQQTELRVLFDLMPAAILFKDTENRILRANQRAANNARTEVSGIEGRLANEIFPENSAKRGADDQEVIHSRSPKVGIIELTHNPEGKEQWTQIDKVPYFDQAGNVLGIVVMAQDITERERASVILKASQQRLTLATKAAHIGIWDWDVRGDRMVWDERMWQLYGLQPQDASNAIEVWPARLHPDERSHAEAEVAAALAGKRDYDTEFRVVWPSGEVRYIEAHAIVVRAADGSAERMIGVNWDITDRRLAEKNQRDNEERFRQLIENVSDVIAVVNDAGCISFQSPSVQRVLGYATHEITGHRFTEFVHPDDQEKARQGLQRAFGGLPPGLPVEYRIKHRDGTWRIFQANGRAMADATGAAQVVVNSRDITEARKLEEQFLRAQRLEAVGTLSSGIAHDLNNILAPILLIASILKEKQADPHDSEMLTMVERAAQRGADIIKQLLTFSRGIAGDRGPVQARHLLSEMLVLMRETFPREITILQEIDPELAPVNADATQIHQVLMNLCVNARDAMPRGGKLTLAAKNVKVTASEAAREPTAVPGPYVCITISDTGEGIPRENLVRIFEPFFTTKEVGKGTGLGLSTVRGIVKSHGGFVTVYSEPGRGTSFKVFLPVIGDRHFAKLTGATVAPWGGQELILIVDDEPAIRRALTATLEQGNYRVLVAADGKEAVSLFLLNRENIRLVLTDIMMPGMNGIALIRTLRALEPRLHIIASSGLHDQDRHEELAALGVKTILAKPCSPREILRAVHQELASGRAGP